VTDDIALHIGAEISQQLHCVELLTLFACIDQPPAFNTNPVTLDEDWLVMPLPEVEETMVPLPRTPWIKGPPGVVTVEVPPRGGSGHVSPAVIVEVVPFAVMVELMPVARPLNSCAVTIWACAWTVKAAKIAALIQRKKKVSLPLFICVLL
jgi:hypothetical protein